jgi:hypothetical protein
VYPDTLIDTRVCPTRPIIIGTIADALPVLSLFRRRVPVFIIPSLAPFLALPPPLPLILGVDVIVTTAAIVTLAVIHLTGCNSVPIIAVYITTGRAINITRSCCF